MKILVFSQYYYPENFRINTLCAELVKKGYEVTVVTGYPSYPAGKIYDGYGFFKKYEKYVDGVKIIRLPVIPRGSNKLMMLFNMVSYVLLGYLWCLFAKEKYDSIFVFEVSPVTVALPAVLFKKMKKIPVYMNVQDLWPENVEHVLGIHNKFILKCIDKIVDYIYKNCEKILCSSQSFVNNIKNRGVDEGKLVFWPQFCEKPCFQSMKCPEEYNDDEFNVVFTGNIGKSQGLDLLIDAVGMLAEENVKWYIVGDGRAKDELYRKAQGKNILDKLVFVGRVSEHEANCYVAFADVAYLSFADNVIFDMTIPAKLQTYLACGTPILAAVGGESADIIKSGKCGIVVAKTPNAICEGVKTMMSFDNDEINNIKNSCKEFFENNYSKDKIVDELINIIYEKEAVNV